MDARDVTPTQDAPVPLITSDWLPAHVAGIAAQARPEIAVVRAEDVHRLHADLDVWDVWPVQLADGHIARFDGASVWMGLSAPVMGDPALRHQKARIRLMLERDGAFADCGDAMPYGFSPGACEWSGSAIYRPETGRVDLHFTATSRRGEAFRHEQRLFATSADLTVRDDAVQIGTWTQPVETIAQASTWRRPADGSGETPGFIDAFRDPAVFRDPRDGAEYLLYAATLAEGDGLFNGAVGVAAADGRGGWRDLGPLLRAKGVNHELERPHIVHADGRYYLFWCTQKKMFAPGGPSGPTGLYGMVADSVLGPYRPLNGTGLVAANPAAEPDQTYAWWVSGDLLVAGFIDIWGVNGLPETQVSANPRDHFGGAIAPLFRLVLDGDSAGLANATFSQQ